MYRYVVLLFFVFITFNIKVFAHIDVVYPASNNIKTSASSIFFIGNTSEGADFSINNEKVKLWDNNFFVQVIPLNFGQNVIRLTSIHNDLKEEKIYTINRPKPVKNNNQPIVAFYPKKENEYLYTKTIKDNVAIRKNPTLSAERVVDLPKNVVLYISGKQGDFYKIEEDGEFQLWINKSNIEAPISVSEKNPAELKNIKINDDSKYNYIHFNLSYPVLYSFKQLGNNIELTLYGVNYKDKNEKEVNNYKYTYSQANTILGYDAYYNNNTLIFRIAKTPKIKDTEYPLRNIAIFIDPGHGGSEKGSVGPTRTCEKDINLAISRYLMKYLEKEGADVIISRLDDHKVGLYERVNMAKSNDALISISIHNNALPNGKDPYINHGTEVHYYNENAKLLAEIIKNDLVQNLYFKDNGIHKSSFALNRSTNPISILVECAYMINPEEYMRLRNPVIQKQIAKSIKNSLKTYILEIQDKR